MQMAQIKHLRFIIEDYPPIYGYYALATVQQARGLTPCRNAYEIYKSAIYRLPLIYDLRA